MPPLRLVGLFLFITSIFLGLMAMATRTAHIRVKRMDRLVEPEQSPPFTSAPPPFTSAPQFPPSQPAPQPASQFPTSQPNTTASTNPTPTAEFRSVPITYPLLIVGSLGLLLWFVPSMTTLSDNSKNSVPRRSKKHRRASSTRRSPSSSWPSSSRSTSSSRRHTAHRGSSKQKQLRRSRVR